MRALWLSALVGTVAGVVVALGDGQPAEALWPQVEEFIAGRGPEAILQGELDWWTAWHAVETPPPDLTGDELAVYRQSTAILKMGQVREPGPGNGQILASLLPGIWNVSWVRDAAYAILGLVESGHHAEARLALEFMLGAQPAPAEGGGHY